MKKTTIGFLRIGDIFILDSKKYKVGNLIGDSDYVACTDMETRKIKRFYIDAQVVVEE